VKRDWSEAEAKKQREGRCRVCGKQTTLQSAHTVGREHDGSTIESLSVIDPDHPDAPDPGTLVRARDIVPLCRDHHTAYDARQLDLLPHLSYDEQAAAVEHLGIVRALKRLTSGM